MFNRDEWILEHQNPMISLKKWQTTVDLIAKLYEAPAAYVIQCNAEQFQVVVASSNITNPYRASDSFARTENLFSEQVVTSCNLLYVNHASNMQEWSSNPIVKSNRINSYLGVPIYWPDGSNFGVICVMDYAVTHYNKTYQDLLWQFRDLVKADLMLNSQFMQMLELSTKDEMSRLLNRRGFFIQAEKHLRLAQRLKLPLNRKGVVVLEVDRRSPAASVGLRPGDIIREVNGIEIEDTETMQVVARDTGRRWDFAVERDGRILRQRLRF